MGDSIKKAEELKAEGKKKISVTYTLERFKNSIITLRDAKMLNEEEKVQLSKIYNDVKNREIGEELKL